MITSFSSPVVYVKHDAIGVQTGESWTNAFHDISSAIMTAELFSIGEVWVAGGIYNESITMASNVILSGGYEGVATNRDIITWPTTIDASTAAGGNPADHVVFMDSLTNPALMVSPSQAVRPMDLIPTILEVVSTSLIWMLRSIANCIIDGNSAYRGGGLYMVSSSLSMTDCSIINNVASTRQVVFPLPPRPFP